MKKLFVCILALLFALTACAVAEEAPALTETAAQGDGYTIAYDATAFAFYRDGVIEGTTCSCPRRTPSARCTCWSPRGGRAGRGGFLHRRELHRRGRDRACQRPACAHIHAGARGPWATPPTSSKMAMTPGAYSASARSRRRPTHSACSTSPIHSPLRPRPRRLPQPSRNDGSATQAPPPRNAWGGACRIPGTNCQSVHPPSAGSLWPFAPVQRQARRAPSTPSKAGTATRCQQLRQKLQP